LISPDVFTANLCVWTIIGVVLGVVVGCIPGLTGAMVIALTLPLTFSMAPSDALALLVSIYVGSVSGGLISATLLCIPGTPASMMTTLDGYPMARDGRPQRALGLGIVASLTGGVLSWLALALLAQPMAVWSTEIGPADMCSLVVLALVLIAVISRHSLLAGLFAGALGILARMPGMHPASGKTRLTFGFHELDDGLSLLPVLIGLFAISQLLKDVTQQTETPSDTNRQTGPKAKSSSSDDRLPGAAEWTGSLPNLLRSSFIGTMVGILPGVGANIGSVVAYSTAKTLSKKKEDFGSGSEEGILASEAANNATVGGALIPLVALGIPGSVIDAILLGAFVIHGLQPGPLLFANNPEVVYTISASYLFANVVMGGFMLLSARWLVRLTQIPKAYLIPAILTFCVLGSYAISNRMFDVWVMLTFGLIGLGFDRLTIPSAPFVIGFVLSPIAEKSMCTALMAEGGSWMVFLTTPMSATLLVISTCICLAVFVAGILAARRTSQETDAAK